MPAEKRDFFCLPYKIPPKTVAEGRKTGKITHQTKSTHVTQTTNSPLADADVTAIVHELRFHAVPTPSITIPLPAASRVSVPGFAPPFAVNRARLLVVNSSNFLYSTPVRRVLTELRLIPNAEHGLQVLRERTLHVAPVPYDQPERGDEWGNRVIQTRHDTVASQLTIVADLLVETMCAYTEAGSPLPIPVAHETGDRLGDFASTTALTAPDAAMNHDARRFGQEISRSGSLQNDPFGFTARLASRVHQAMTFRSGSTSVGTTAREAWENRMGVCQDYTHILLAFCRILGVPARYVSGMVPGEGVMHAWAEVLLPASPHAFGETNGRAAFAEQLCWYPIDPTYNKWVNEKYVAVAVGRDYRDALPTSGTYYGGKSDLRYKSRVTIAASDTRILQSE